MTTATLGKKLKEARIAKKMTQNEVVGDFITRNMLSQIESGSATPSIKTLEYLCGVLDLPIHQVMPDGTQDALSQLAAAKNALAEGSYETIFAMNNDFPEQLFDEFAAISAQAFLALSRRKVDEGDYAAAVKLAQSAIELSEKGIYSNTALRTDAILHLNQVAEKLSSYYGMLTRQP